MDDAERLSDSKPTQKELQNLNESDWTVLNLDFGIPLFDSNLNAEVCDRITSQQLWQRERLDALMLSQTSLSERLMDFIQSHGDAPTHSDKSTPEVVLPTKNLLFVDGKLIPF